MQHRRTKWVWTDGFSSSIWKWECFHAVECQQVESSRWMEQQDKKCDGPVQCVCEERQAKEHRMSAEPEVVHGSVSARWDMLSCDEVVHGSVPARGDMLSCDEVVHGSVPARWDMLSCDEVVHESVPARGDMLSCDAKVQRSLTSV